MLNRSKPLKGAVKGCHWRTDWRTDFADGGAGTTAVVELLDFAREAGGDRTLETRLSGDGCSCGRPFGMECIWDAISQAGKSR